MGTNPNFNPTPRNLTSEQDLLEDLIVESINLTGTNVWYLPRESRSTPDQIYGEDPTSQFTKAYLIPMYLSSFLGPSGPSEIFSKFGMAISDSHRYVVARKTFQKAVPSVLRTRPTEGDLIYVPAFNDLVEIKFAEQEKNFYPLARRQPYFYSYELSVESFKFSNEVFLTGVQDIDKIGRDYNYTITLQLSSTSNTNLDFQVGETAYQPGTGSTAVVKDWDSVNQVLEIMHANGILANVATITGNTSNATYLVASYNYLDFSGVTEDFSDNNVFQDEAIDVVDTSDQNPFGMPV